MVFGRILGRRLPAGTLAVGAVLAAGCTSVPAPPRELLQLSDAETVFVGFNNPTERIIDRLSRLYGTGSVPLSMSAGQVDDSTVNVEVRSDVSDEEGTPGVRCFVYTLDAATQQAHLEDFTTGACAGLSEEAAR